MDAGDELRWASLRESGLNQVTHSPRIFAEFCRYVYSVVGMCSSGCIGLSPLFVVCLGIGGVGLSCLFLWVAVGMRLDHSFRRLASITSEVFALASETEETWQVDITWIWMDMGQVIVWFSTKHGLKFWSPECGSGSKWSSPTRPYNLGCLETKQDQ